MVATVASVAAIIPAYNCARFLPEAVASIRRQTVPVEQIVIVDDGSTDGTEETVRRLGGNILYLKQQNAGPSAARNTGVRAAGTEWVAFLDADDLWLPEKTERQLALVEKHPALALIASNRTEVDAAGAVIVQSLFDRHGLRIFFEELDGDPIPDALARLVRKNFIPTSSALVRRRVMEEFGGFNTDIRFSEDLELWCRIAARHPIACLPAIHTLYRRHGANAVEKTELMLQGSIQTMRSLRARCRDSLRTAGCDPDRLVAEHQAGLGYFYFDRARYPEARKVLRQSLSEKMTSRALFYLLASCLPFEAVRIGRNIKQTLTGGT
jgi:glycosyltransferase involved in cell wall biosynthesis